MIIKAKKIASMYILLFAVLSFQGCADIEEVNSAAKTAIATLKTYKEINYSLTESYKKYAVPENIYNGVNRLTAGNPVRIPVLTFDSTTLKKELQADQVINLFFTSLTAYFEALSKLSDKDLVDADFSKLGEELKNEAVLGSLKNVTTKHIDASVKIATILTNNIMGAYRERHVRRIICDYSADVDTVLVATDHCLEILIKRIGSDMEKIKTKYGTVLDSNGVELETKVNLLKDISDESSTLQNQKAKLAKLRQGLAKIRKAHSDLATVLKDDTKLKSEDAKRILKQYVGDAYSIYEQIQQLK